MQLVDVVMYMLSDFIWRVSLLSLIFLFFLESRVVLFASLCLLYKHDIMKYAYLESWIVWWYVRFQVFLLLVTFSRAVDIKTVKKNDKIAEWRSQKNENESCLYILYIIVNINHNLTCAARFTHSGVYIYVSSCLSFGTSVCSTDCVAIADSFVWRSQRYIVLPDYETYSHQSIHNSSSNKPRLYQQFLEVFIGWGGSKKESP